MTDSVSIVEIGRGGAGDGRGLEARDGDRLVATLKLTWGGDADFSEEQSNDFVLPLFLGHVAAGQVVLAERLAIDRKAANVGLVVRLISACLDFVRRKDGILLLMSCTPGQVQRFLALGFRTYTRRTINRPESGYLVPLAMVVGDWDYLRAVGSPLADAATDLALDLPVPGELARLFGAQEAIDSRKLFLKEEFWARLKRDAMPEKVREVGLFDGMGEVAIRACLENSTSYECDAGFKIITKGETATNIFMVLSGTLEVRDGDEVVAIIGEGEAFGEIAFFLGLPRTMDVVSVTQGTKVVSFSEGTIRRLIYHDPETATKLLLNLSKMLCARMVNQA